MISLIGTILSDLLYLALHIANFGSFPKPLSAADETKYLLAFEKGDMEARNKLIIHNLRLVVHIIKKYYSTNYDQDDLISIGTIGLIKGINTFNCNRNIRLATYASKCIENEILMHFRSQKKCMQDVSLHDPIETDNDGNSLSLMEVIATEDSIIDDLDLKLKSERVRQYIRESLDTREQTIIELRYGLGGKNPLPQREVAKKLGISRSYVSRIEKKALAILKKQFDMESGPFGLLLRM